MAKGFAAGLVQGALACGAGLVALSLALPQPQQAGGDPVQAALPAVTAPDPGTMPQPAAQPEAATIAVPKSGPETAPDAGAVPVAVPTAAPDIAGIAETLTVPEGSGFARGQDVQPQAPVALAVSDPVADPPPAMLPPPDEIAPGPAEPTPLPEVRGDAPEAPVMRAPAPDAVELPRSANEAPGMVQTPGLDRMPEQIAGQVSDAPATLPAPALMLPDPPAEMPSDLAAEVTAEHATPAADQGRGFDLSTPPDFGALRLNPSPE